MYVQMRFSVVLPENGAYSMDQPKVAASASGAEPAEGEILQA